MLLLVYLPHLQVYSSLRLRIRVLSLKNLLKNFIPSDELRNLSKAKASV